MTKVLWEPVYVEFGILYWTDNNLLGDWWVTFTSSPLRLPQWNHSVDACPSFTLSFLPLSLGRVLVFWVLFWLRIK